MALDALSLVRSANTSAPDAPPAAATHGARQAGAWLMPGEPKHTANDDCDTLLSAIESRLRSVVDSTVPMDPALQPPLHMQMRAQVLECVQALEQLQMLLTHERQRHGSAASGAALVQAQLTQALADLARTRSEELLAKHRALHDGLTSLPNRSFFRQRLDHALTEHASAPMPLAVLYLDLDGMKQVNDRHGHCVGDRLLQIVASRLSGAVRSADVVSRQGGDEFALLMAPPPGREDLAALAVKLYDTVAAPVQLGAVQFSVRASIGIAMTPLDGDSADTLLDHADAAMYQAKRQQSRYAFFDAMTAAAWTQRRGRITALGAAAVPVSSPLAAAAAAGR